MGENEQLAVVVARLDDLRREVDRIRTSLDGRRAHWTTVVAVTVAGAALMLDAVPRIA